MKKDSVQLLTTQDGMRFDYIEPSVVCAAQHALSILDHEEGSVHCIQARGETVWTFDGKKSLLALEELAVGVCSKA